MEVWPVPLRHRLPQFPIPLAAGDPDVPLDLQGLFDAVYDRAGYDYSVDYGQGAVPALSQEDASWARALLDNDVMRMRDA